MRHIVHGTVRFENGKDIFQFGTSYGLTSNPDTTYRQMTEYLILNDTVVNIPLSGLLPNTTYYVRMIAMKNSGITYFSELHFTTLPEITYGSVTDVEGNIYKTVKIGTQTWMAENLRTTKYNDNTPISLIEDNASWISLSTPAYCWYNNDRITYGETYGALYNWYTVNSGKLCPTGWQVPTDVEWTTMENYLIMNGYNYDGTGSDNKIAKSIASHSDWTASTSDGAVGNIDYPAIRNATGFTAVPGGLRYYLNGRFHNIEDQGCYWSSTEPENSGDNGSAWYRNLFYSNSSIDRQNLEKERRFFRTLFKTNGRFNRTG